MYRAVILCVLSEFQVMDYSIYVRKENNQFGRPR